MKFRLQDIDSDDLSDIVATIEASFRIKFDKDSSDIKNIGELCDYVVVKLNLEDVNDCTSQQAFYKLRFAICKHTGINKDQIKPNSLLKELFPKNSRHRLVKRIEREFGHQIYLLRPPYWITTTLFILFIASAASVLIKWQIGLSGLVLSTIGFTIATRLGKCLTMVTVKELTSKLATFQYIQSRRNPKTFNKAEIEDVIITIFEESIGPFESKLNRNSVFT